MSRILSAALFLFALVIVAGCDKKTAPTEIKGKDGHDHSHHERKDAKMEDIELMGKEYHVGLTAHLSKEPGKHELDVFFETHDEKPHAIPMAAKVTARVTRKGDDNAYYLTFEPAEKDERKDDPADKCSRFAAKAAWMKDDDSLDVVVSVEIDKSLKKVTFSDFVPKKYAHEHK